MEVTAANNYNEIPVNEIPILAQKVNDYISSAHSSITAVSKAIGYNRTTVSRYLSGQYDSDSSKLESKLSEFLSSQIGEVIPLYPTVSETPSKPGIPPAFFESRDAKAVLGVCQSCQEDAQIGIIVSKSGYGKTYALQHFAKLPRVIYVECNVVMGSRDLVEAIEREIGLPRTYGSTCQRAERIADYFKINRGYLLIIDEADKLISKYTQNKMELIRSISDKSNVGLVIAGEPKLETQIKMYLEQMANRIAFYALLQGLSPSEVEGYLENFTITPDALVELKARACNMKTGCFRLLDRTLSNVRRILNERGEATITVKIIEQASSMMML